MPHNQRLKEMAISIYGFLHGRSKVATMAASTVGVVFQIYNTPIMGAKPSPYLAPTVGVVFHIYITPIMGAKPSPYLTPTVGVVFQIYITLP